MKNFPFLKLLAKLHPPSPNPSRKGRGKKILVIRFGALGDLVMCRQAFHEIREAHKDAEIALLTTPPFAEFARAMPWFDRVIAEPRAPGWQLHRWASQIARLYQFAPDRVYDLQGKFRQSVMFALLGGPFWGPEWSGAAPLCRYPRLWPPAPGMHFVEFLSAQLRRAGVPEAPPADLSWLDAPLKNIALPERFVMLIPACSPKLAHKRWPAAHYAALANRLRAEGLASVAIGAPSETGIVDEIRRDAPEVIDVSGKTSLFQIAAIARRATGAVGNDTGPMHMAAAVGAPTLAVLSSHTDPVWSRPWGPVTGWLKRDQIADLPVDEVFLALMALLDTTKK